jgi:hypothetical protein
MSKLTVTRLFIGAAVAFVMGLVLGLVTVVVALANGVVTIGGADAVAVDGEAVGGIVVWLVVATLLVGGGTLLAIVSWIGALFNTARLEDKTWFIVLLVLGLASFGWVGMIAYVVAGPDGYTERPAGQTMTSTVLRS